MLLGLVLLSLSLSHLQGLDARISLAVASIRRPWLTVLMKAATQLAGAPWLIVLSLVLVLFVRQKRYQVPLFANLLISVVLNLGLKDLFTRVRPVEVAHLVVETGYSFPSGHSMAAAAYYGFLIYLLRRSRLSKRAQRAGSAMLLLVILLVGFSRVYLGVHYASDVLAGFLFSGLYLMVFTAFVTAYFHGSKSLGEELEAKSAPSLLVSFAHAIDGVISGLKAERNMVIHFGMMSLVIALAILLRCNVLEWCILLILFGMVLGAELINTAIEAAVDLNTRQTNPLAKLAKDTAAGAVLVTALVSAVVGLIILGPKLYWLIRMGLWPGL